MIVPLGEYTLCRQVHRGNKNIAEEFNENVKFLSERQNEIKGLIKSMSIEKSAIEDLQADFKADYLSKKLNLNRKETEKVIDLYENTYDGRTRWGMANAITEFARDLKDINRREYIERAAFRVA
jgi:capsular polysaccharide biosynthesis protein